MEDGSPGSGVDVGVIGYIVVYNGMVLVVSELNGQSVTVGGQDLTVPMTVVYTVDVVNGKVELGTMLLLLAMGMTVAVDKITTVLDPVETADDITEDGRALLLGMGMTVAVEMMKMLLELVEIADVIVEVWTTELLLLLLLLLLLIDIGTTAAVDTIITVLDPVAELEVTREADTTED